jgi:plastocyanin
MRSVLLKGSVGAAALALCWSCGGGYSAPTPTTPSPSDSNAITISVVRQNGAQSFSPNPASAGGQVVVFKNNDSIVHRVILNDGTLDTGDIAPGATSRALTMPSAGTNYHCTIHPSMVGSVSPAAGGAPPPCEGAYC